MSHDQPTAPDALSQILERLQRIEEVQAFAQHTEDAMTREIRELDRRVRELGARLARLEGRIGELGKAVAEPDSPSADAT